VSGLLGFLVSSDNSAANVASSGCGRAATECFIPAHARATVVTDLSDHAIRLMERRDGHGLYRCRDGQDKGDSDQPDHFFSPLERYKSVDPNWRADQLGLDQTP
jgi:hypothetical protein